MATSSRRVIEARHLHRAAFILFILGIFLILLTVRVPDPPPSEVFSGSEIRIAVDPGLPPFAFFDDEQVAGVEVDLGRAIGDILGVNVRFHPTSFDGIYDVVTSGTADIAIARVRFNPFRTHEVLYTRPYFNAGLVLVAPTNSDIEGMKDIGGQRLAYAFGSDADTEARRWSRRVATFEKKAYEQPIYALDAVRLNQADAALVDAITARIYLRDHPEWAARTIQAITVDPLSIIVDIRNRDMWRHVDLALGEILREGNFLAILNTWM